MLHHIAFSERLLISLGFRRGRGGPYKNRNAMRFNKRAACDTRSAHPDTAAIRMINGE